MTIHTTENTKDTMQRLFLDDLREIMAEYPLSPYRTLPLEAIKDIPSELIQQGHNELEAFVIFHMYIDQWLQPFKEPEDHEYEYITSWTSAQPLPLILNDKSVGNSIWIKAVFSLFFEDRSQTLCTGLTNLTLNPRLTFDDIERCVSANIFSLKFPDVKSHNGIQEQIELTINRTQSFISAATMHPESAYMNQTYLSAIAFYRLYVLRDLSVLEELSDGAIKLHKNS